MSRIVVLNFHGIGEPHAGVPVDEVPYWLDKARFAQVLDQVTESGMAQRTAFTFDDGNKSDLLAAEMLEQRGMTGRFFVLTGRFGMDHYLTPGDIRNLADYGMAVGLHGCDHVDWRKLDHKAFEAETAGARADLADALGDNISEVAIPFGAYNRRVMSGLQRQGFERIHTSDPGMARETSRIWQRNTLRSDMDAQRVAGILQDRAGLPVRGRRLLRRSLKRYLL